MVAAGGVCLPLAAACHGPPKVLVGPDSGISPPRVEPPAAEPARPVDIDQSPLPAAGPQLPPLMRARLDYMFEAARLVAADWPRMTPESTCVLLIDVHTQWVVNCELAPAGFVLTGEIYRDHAVYAHSGGTFQSSAGKHTTAQWLAQTPAAAHVPEGHSALPGNDPWLVIGSLEALTAYHPSFSHASTEAWVSVAIHEFVHTHQLREPSFAPYLAAITAQSSSEAPLRRLYERDARYRALVRREYELLSRAAKHDAQDRSAAKLALRKWRALYEQRVSLLSKRGDAQRLITDDELFSYLEGVARFVESDFLTNTAQHPHSTLDGDPRFHDYAAFLGKGYAGSPNRQLDSQYVYAIGYHLCELMQRINTRWTNSVNTQSHWLHGLVRELAAEGGGG